MKLYSGALSLFGRKVEIVLHEKNLIFERVMVPFSQTLGYVPKHPHVVAANPKGQVPVFVDGSLTLYDSTVIMEYLEDAYPNPPVYPKSPRDRAKCRLFDLFADEIMLVPLRGLMHRTDPIPTDPERWTLDEAKASQCELVIRQHFAEVDRGLQQNTFLCGDFSAADISVFMPVLWTQRLGGPSLTKYPSLFKWYTRLSKRPAFANISSEIKAADIELSAPLKNGRRA